MLIKNHMLIRNLLISTVPYVKFPRILTFTADMSRFTVETQSNSQAW